MQLGTLREGENTSIGEVSLSENVYSRTFTAAENTDYVFTIVAKAGFTYQNAKALITLSDAVSDNSGTDVKPYIQGEANRVAQKVRNVQTGTSLTFIACSDLHYAVYTTTSVNETPEQIQAALKDMRDGIKAIAEQTHIDFYSCFGDLIYQLAGSTYGPNYENGVQEMIGATKLLNDAFGNNRQVRLVGNHDPNCENNNAKEFTAHLLNAYMGIYSDMLVKNESYPYGGYGYHDFERQKIRLIVLNTSFYTQGQNISNNATHYYVGPVQVRWLTAQMDLTDKQDANEWQIVIFSHVALDNRTLSMIYPCADILEAYNKGEAATVTFPTGNVTCDFRNGKNAAQIAFAMNGHAHLYSWRNIITKAKATGESTAHDVETTINGWRYIHQNSKYGAIHRFPSDHHRPGEQDCIRPPLGSWN